MAIEAGSSLGPYEILSRLGSGGMGEVWKARDTRLGRLVAIKVLKRGDGDPESRRRLLREAQIASRLNHPNVCTLHDVGSEGALDYLVMELLEGETLLDRLFSGPLPEEELLRVARGMAAGLAHAHANGFVHRDLKPSNVFLTPSGAKLLDFGLARGGVLLPGGDESAAPTASRMTAPGTVLGTVGYMSPEQVRGESAGPASDVFSFGAVLYEMGTGKRAFQGETAVETLHAILKTDPPPLAASRPVESKELQPLVDRCLAKNPSARFASGVDLAGALGGFPLLPAAVRPLLKPPHRLLKIGITVAGLLLAATVGVLWSRVRRSPPLDSLAILPLANATGNADLEYVGEGLSESLIRTMAQVPDLRVMAESTVGRYRGAGVDPLAAGRELHVRAVLTGSVRSLGDRLAVSVSLVDAGDGRHLWGETYERSGGKIPALEAEIAGEIASALRLRLTGQARRQIAKVPTENREAYLDYLKGRYFWGKRTETGLLSAIDLFRRAIDRDPAYAPAWAGLAAAWDVLGYSGYRPTEEAFPRAKDAARRALQIDPENAGALAVLAHVTWLHEHDAAASEALFRKAMTIEPANADARHWYAHFLSQNGRLEESSAQAQKLMEIEPLSLVANIHLAEELEIEGRLDDAAIQLKKTIELDRNFFPAWLMLGHLETKRGRPKEAVAAFREAERLEPDAPGLKKTLDAAIEAAERPR